MRVWTKAMVLGLAIALAGIGAGILPPVVDLEADLGLEWLFTLRGRRPAPDKVIVVAIDRKSSDRLGLSNEPDEWPRSLHARLVHRLVEQGAGVIVFDIIFDESRNAAEDHLFAEAISDAGNVVLLEYLERESRPLTDPAGAPVAQANIERCVPPIAELAEAAAALAPFPLPKVPVKLSQYWLFKTGAGDVPTLPAAAFQVYSLPSYDDLARALLPHETARLPGIVNAIRENRDLEELWRSLRRTLQTDPTLVQSLLTRLQDDATIANPHSRRVLSALIEMHSGGDSRYLDFYGPPGSITTVPYYQVLQQQSDGVGRRPRVEFSEAAVFVGFAEQLRPEQKDGFYTVFSQPDGLDVSGVEIAATAFANLLERRAVKMLPSPFHFLAIILWGIAVGALFLFLPAGSLLPTAGALVVGYMGGAYYAFARGGTWLPVVVPMLVQMPAALVSGLLWQYLDTRRERQKIREAFSYYLPRSVVDELTGGTRDIETAGRLVYGVCLNSDAEQYTTLSETLDPGELRSVLNRYYQALFQQVRRRGGFISDVVGDEMLAIWAAASSDAKIREQACHAALDIIAVVDDFNRSTPGVRLPTRVGLHCGEMLLGNVGAADHYEYRAVGDIVNTAARVQSLNKELGTRVIASRQVIDGLHGIVTRELGSFRLAGKVNPLVMHELVCQEEGLDAARRDRYARFASALQAFQMQRWKHAVDAFQELLEKCDDGPSHYYLRLCENYAQDPPQSPWDGVVRIDRK